MWMRRVLLVVLVSVLNLRGDAIAGLIGHWAMDDGAGTVAKDSSGGGHDGQLVDGPQWVEGLMGGALELDGVKARVDVPYWPELTPGKGTTIACWVFPKDTGRACLVGQFEGYGMALMTGLQLKSVIWGGDWVLSDVTISESEWSHIVMTWDVANNKRKVYVAGELVGERPDSVVPKVQNNLGIGLWIGWPDSWGDDSFTGLMDDVRLYNVILTADQVVGLRDGVAPTFTKASEPKPADGALNVSMGLLQWTRGETAASHDVYMGAGPELTEADRVVTRQTQSITFYYHAVLTPGATYYWRVDENDEDGVTVHQGDVWTFVAQDVTAYHPIPADGASDVSPAPTLTWMPGIGAIGHHLYFADDPNAVSAATAETDKGMFEIADTAFAPGTLESLATYYWRVDETVAGGAVKTGPVWSFTTYLPIDDFESYNDDDNRVYETWIDGLMNSASGSMVGYDPAPFMELTVVHDANQSMPFHYNNVDSPFYSEGERRFETAQDWTIGDADTLVLSVHGRLTNKPEPLYVAIEDQSKHLGAVVYPDPAIVTRNKWIDWAIPFSEFTAAGVNMARVRTLYIGLGDKNDPQPGTSGLIFIDDVRLIRAAPDE